MSLATATIESVQCSSPAGLHRIAYKQWGDPANPRVLVCVHGVTRVSDDFDALAANLSDTYRVICPDVVGRGRSGRLALAGLYTVPQYVADMVTLIARVTNVPGSDGTVDWFGTSMGGLIGLVLASLPGNPVGKLVLNDIGPIIDPGALARIGDYIGQDLRFASFEEGAQYVRAVSASFGPHSDAEWHKLAADVLRQDRDGQWKRHYDMALAQPFKAATPETAQRDEAALSAATARMMTARGPQPQLVEIAGVGHAPTFVQEDQIAIARRFLLG
jgi:pimeloyl-ACP methyl ester carboxylesterase